MIEISLREDLNERKGKAIGTKCSFKIEGNGGVIASQVKAILDTFDKELPQDIWMTALDSFLSDRIGGMGCDDDE